MTFSSELSIVISFAAFAVVFAWKIYPFVLEALDGYIDEIKLRISKAEEEENKALRALEQAAEKKGEIEKLLEIDRLESKEKMCELREESEQSLALLREHHEVSLKNQLEAEFVKQKNVLIDRLSDLIIGEVGREFEAEDFSLVSSIKSGDFNKLLETRF